MEIDYFTTNMEIANLEKREAVRLGQIAKKNWLMKRDQNTKFFHAVINQRRKEALVSRMVLVDSTTFENAESVHLGVAQYFQNFLSTQAKVV